MQGDPRIISVAPPRALILDTAGGPRRDHQAG
jgi:hypothetical protein